MKLPYRPKLLPVARRRFKYIIIHDISCQFEDIIDLMVDSSRFQVEKMKSMNYILHGLYELNYHFVVDKIDNDYNTLVARPLYSRCEFDDIESPYDHAVHICVMGDFHNENPGNRFYQHLAYHTVIPMMRLYRIPISQVVLHKEISNANETCPGPNFRTTLLQSYLKSWKITN